MTLYAGGVSRDEIFADGDQGGQTAPFQFSEKVVAVFEDMIRRSVPGYELTLTAIEAIAGREVRAGSRVYDLGSSLGASVESVWRAVRGKEVEIHGVDNSAAMVTRARELLDLPGVFFHEGDAVSWPMAGASLIVMNFTLQFVPLAERQALLTRCCQALAPGGVLFLSEKFVSPCEEDGEWLQELHWEFKRQQGYSELEIARKREALEEVLFPELLEVHEQRLQEAGFSQVTQVLQCLNFASWVARKE